MFAEATIGSAKAGRTSYEDLSGAAELLTDSERQYTYYDVALGWNPEPGRAIGHGVADLLTLGAWELVGTPVEAVQGDKYRLTIAYDKDNKAKTISSQKI